MNQSINESMNEQTNKQMNYSQVTKSRSKI